MVGYSTVSIEEFPCLYRSTGEECDAEDEDHYSAFNVKVNYLKLPFNKSRSSALPRDVCKYTSTQERGGRAPS